jgi:hypothetical protein
MRVGWLLVALVACSSDGASADACAPDDADGIVGVELTAQVTVDDHGFAPPIVKVQNKSLLSLTVTNAGTRPHGFSVDCLPTPNARGCPARSCFPDDATIAPLAPGASKTVKFATPAVEGIYTYRSRADGDAALTTGQLILQ